SRDTERGTTKGPLRIDSELRNELAAFDDFDPIAPLANDGSRIAAHKGVAADMFTAFYRFEEKRFALAADLSIRRKRCIKIGKQAASDRNQIPVRGQLAELFNSWRIHGLSESCGAPGALER